MLKINLAPEVQQKRSREIRNKRFATIFAICIFGGAVLVTFFILTFSQIQKSRLESTNARLSELKSELEGYKEVQAKIVSIGEGLNGLEVALLDKRSWNRLLPHIDLATPRDVTFKALEISENGEVEASLEGRDIGSVARYIESFKDYKVVLVQGSGLPGEVVSASHTRGEVSSMVMPSGRWILSVPFEPSESQQVVITIGTASYALNYSAESERFTAENQEISSETKYMFEGVTVSRHEREPNGSVGFVALFKIQEGLLW